ncbi:unnamed protein product [Camellia sinensis]
MSPEYAIDRLFSIKSDVFSFWVLVLEIINGKKNRGFYHPDHNLNLLGHVSVKTTIYLISQCKDTKLTDKMSCNCPGMEPPQRRQVFRTN